MAVLSWVSLLFLLIDCCRGFQSTARRDAVLEYASHWEKLLLSEYEESAAELHERRKTWSRRRLEENGISVFGGCANPDSEMFGEKIVRIDKQGETRFRDRFNRGDVLLLTPMAANVDPIPRDCLVVDVGKDWLTVGVGPRWPPGLWEARKLANSYLVRLDRAAPQAPLRAQRSALDRMRKGVGGKTATFMADLFYDSANLATTASAVPSRFDPLELESSAKTALEKAKKATTFQPNQSQENAIVWALQRQMSLIRGPPGTGKTRVAALLIASALRLPQATTDDNIVPHRPRVLAVTHSNGAADVLLQALLQMGVPAVRVGRPASVSPKVQHRTVIAMSEKMPEVVRLRRKVSDMTLDSQVRSAAAFDLQQCVLEVQQMITKTAPVIVTSCVGAHQLWEDRSSDTTFPLVVLDEAAQTTEPALLCALVAARAEQMVLVGDTRQLPPTITSMRLRDTLGVSPMARLENCNVGQITLRVQYRMPPALLQHPSQYFYNGLVTCAPENLLKKQRLLEGFAWPSSEPLAFVQTGHGESEAAHNFGGRSNPTEARMVVNIVSDLLKAGDVEHGDIAVISPYSKQVQLLRTELAARSNTQNIRVGTVDSFQGQETEVVVFSAVRSNPLQELGFLRDSRRLCVAITRAKQGLILVGDQKTLRSCRHWAALLDSCEERGCTVLAKDLKATPVPPADLEDALVVSEDESIKGLYDETDEYYGLFAPTSAEAN